MTLGGRYRTLAFSEELRQAELMIEFTAAVKSVDARSMFEADANSA
jgi:hypothetical protein